MDPQPQWPPELQARHQSPDRVAVEEGQRQALYMGEEVDPQVVHRLLTGAIEQVGLTPAQAEDGHEEAQREPPVAPVGVLPQQEYHGRQVEQRRLLGQYGHREAHGAGHGRPYAAPG